SHPGARRRRCWPDRARACRGTATPVAAAGGRAAPLAVSWSEQRDRQDHFLGRDPAVEESPAIAGLILPQLRGVNEEPITGREEQPGPGCSRRQTEAGQVVDHQRSIRLLGPQIVPELVPQVRGGVALGVYRR